MPFQAIPPISLWAAWLVVVLPLFAFGLIIIFLRSHPKTAGTVSIAAIAIAMAGSIYILIRHWNLDSPMEFSVHWVLFGRYVIPLGIILDRLSMFMLVIVTFISFLVQVYSIGYMKNDSGFARYYAFMSLFAWSMISLVLSPTMLLLYIFWELVGLSSYLLIGFWHEKFSATQAGKKAFVMTRIGDVSLFIGMLILLIYGNTWDIMRLNQADFSASLSPHLITLSAILILGGVIGKSAQFPLLTWLPDAMEGPTPVSALLHSATMVAAGAYLLGRLFPFFTLTPTAMTVTLVVGTVSMLMASTMAMVSRDIKQVWAFSTISQLGYMVMALGAGGYFAGIFHLTTHAGFKSLLFLCSGVFIHIYETNDMFILSKNNARHYKVTMACMVVGAAALSGIWPFSGFFSKEAIFTQLAGLHNPIWIIAALAGEFLTAYYTFRLIFILLFPKEKKSASVEGELSHRPSRAESVMVWPLVVLSLVTLVLGFAGRQIEAYLTPHMVETVSHFWVTPAAICLGIAGVLWTWLEFGRKGAAQVGFVERMDFLKRFFENRWFMDRIYYWCVDHLVDLGIAALCQKSDDNVVDGTLHTIGKSVTGTGRIVSGWHNVAIQKKLMIIFAAVFGLSLIILFAG